MTEEIIANIHIHSSYSDGEKLHPEIAKVAAQCGLDVIFITDHNILVEGFDGYYTFGGKRVLLITGEEIHDKNRNPQKNHLLTLGVSKSHANLAKNPQNLIDSIVNDCGLTFIAHAYDPELPAFDEADLSWEDWSVERFTGLELWNNLSEFKIRAKSKLHAFFYAFFPKFLALEPPIQIRNIWDTLLNKGKKIIAIGGSDAHTLTYKFGPFVKEVFPYSFHFKTINTHIILSEQLSYSPKEDSKNIIESLQSGNVFIANDSIKPSKGFCFFAKLNGKVYPMGAELNFKEGLYILAQLPYPADCVLSRNGKPIIEMKKSSQLDFMVTEKGVYRLECFRNYLFKKRGWIFSNPIYIR